MSLPGKAVMSGQCPKLPGGGAVTKQASSKRISLGFQGGWKHISQAEAHKPCLSPAQILAQVQFLRHRKESLFYWILDCKIHVVRFQKISLLYICFVKCFNNHISKGSGAQNKKDPPPPSISKKEASTIQKLPEYHTHNNNNKLNASNMTQIPTKSMVTPDG